MRSRWIAASVVVASAACTTTPPVPRSFVELPVQPPVASGAPAPPSAPPATTSVAARSDVKEIPEPKGECLVDAASPSSGTPLGFGHVYVQGASVASLTTFGEIKHARLALAEGHPTSAALALDSDVFSVRGEVPLAQGSTDDLDLYPRTSTTRLVRDGWLLYKEVRVVSVKGAQLEPLTELEPWIVPAPGFGGSSFYVKCTDVTPFVTKLPEDRIGSALIGPKIALEDESGRKVATVDAPNDGVPTTELAKKNGRSKIRFEAGRHTIAEGWVASRNVKSAGWASLGSGSGHGRGGTLAKMTCSSETPIQVRVADVTYAWGTLHANREVKGTRVQDGSFALSLGGGAGTVPFVPSDRLATCTITP